MSIPMVALRPQTYAGRRVAAGTEFEVRCHSDARLLIALGRADFAPKAAQPAAPAPVPELAPAPVIVAEPESTPEASPEVEDAPAFDEPPAPRPKRQYKRRDLTAEDND